MDWKALLTSKRVWVSIIGLATTFGTSLPPQYGAVLIAVGTLITKIMDLRK